MSLRNRTILDKIGNLIPGYKGYATRDEKRNTEKKFRDQLALSIQQSEKEIIDYQKELISKQQITVCTQWEIVRKAINTLYSKIKNTTYGESSFFSENQLKEDELEEIYIFDLEISERVSVILKTTQEEITEVLSVATVLNQIKEIENSLIKRTNFINQYK